MDDGRGWGYCRKGGKDGWEPPTKVPPPPCSPTQKRETPSPSGHLESPRSARFAGGTWKATGFWSGGRELESVAFGCSSLHSKPTGLLHCYQQLLVELFIRLIRWNVDPVKAGVGLRKVVCVCIDQVDGEQPGACGACRTL